MRNALMAVVLSLAAGELAWADDCGPLTRPGQYGPYDYRTDKPYLPIVEGAHFTPNVEFLQSGNTGSIGGDLSYTLRAFPNHARALWAMMRYSEKMHADKPYGSQYSIGCWFDRAVRWRPDDGMVRMIYGSWLAKHGKREESIAELDKAGPAAEDDPNVAYNLGLVYFEVKLYDKSLKFAQMAYAGGFPLPGLKKKLESIGKWVPPPVAAPAAVPAPVAEQRPVSTPPTESQMK